MDCDRQWLLNLQSLQEHQPSMLFVAQGESSTGLAQPVENLGQLCHKLVTPVHELIALDRIIFYQV